MNKPLSRSFGSALAVLLLTFIWSANSVHGQVITSVNPNSGNAGQTVNLIITGSNTFFSLATSANLFRPGWDIPASSVTPNSNSNLTATFNLPANAQLGQYELRIPPYGPLPNAFTMLAAPAGQYGYISGRVVFDDNQNCAFDGGDTLVENRVVEITPGPYYASTNANGEYGVWVPLGSYSVEPGLSPFQSVQCPAAGSYNVNLTIAGDSTNNQDFYVVYNGPPPFDDLQVTTTTSFHRPGFNASTQFWVRNIGNTIMSGYTLTGVVDGSMFHLSESPPASNVTSTANTHTMTWSLPTMNPGDVLIFNSFDSLPASIPLGTILPNSATITPVDDDSTDNNFFGSRTVTGSYDPNDKQVWTENGVVADGFIDPSDTLLRYLIRCQNTGTDTAFNIYIRDTLDANLEISSLEVTDASHNYQVTVTGPGYVQFTFPNILLVDSATNEPGSNAHIEYTIRTKPGLPIGTRIDNTAHIYFDFNAPIVTNTVSSVICPDNIGSDPGIFSINFNSVQFFNASTGPVTQYAWDFGDGNTSTQQEPGHTYANAGIYNVCLTVTNSCGRTDSSCVVVDLLSGVESPELNAFHLYPNPTSSEVLLELDLIMPAKLNFKVFNGMGKLITQTQTDHTAGMHRQRFDLSDQAAGIYFLRVEVNGRSFTKKIVKK